MCPLALLGNFRASKESVKSFTDVLKKNFDWKNSCAWLHSENDPKLGLGSSLTSLVVDNYKYFLSFLKVVAACQSLSAPPQWGNRQDNSIYIRAPQFSDFFNLFIYFFVESCYFEIKAWRFAVDIAAYVLTL